MKFINAIVGFSMILILNACAFSGPVDDGFENSLESIDIGVLQQNAYLQKKIDNAEVSDFSRWLIR